MTTYTYNWEIKDILTQFLHAFDGAVVKRRDNNGNIQDTIDVRYVYAPKQRVLHDIVNKAQHITLPVICFNISSINRDTSRVFNKLYGYFYNRNDDYDKAAFTLQPVPVDIQISVTILTKFASDMDQIISNFTSYCDPYLVFSWKRYDQPEIEIRSEVIWDGNLNLKYLAEQTPQTQTRVECNTNFTVKGWLFKSDSKANPIDRIFYIDSNFYTAKDAITNYNITPETASVSSLPLITYTSKWITPVRYGSTLNLKGSNLNYVFTVYLSGSDPGMFNTTTTVDLFSGTDLKNSYPALTGVTPVQGFTKKEDGSLDVLYYAPQTRGYFDVIVFSNAGYTKMTYTLGVSANGKEGVWVVDDPQYIWDDAMIIWDAATFEWRVA